ncbi:MAG: hypothetical protein A2Y41_08460 [Spirochaetes bacterium GWB1_36_13]|nr:MAG: hypothetical protein A2Y41_08460 [Spirochaetes bacterium GWB1_36_13]
MLVILSVNISCTKQELPSIPKTADRNAPNEVQGAMFTVFNVLPDKTKGETKKENISAFIWKNPSTTDFQGVRLVRKEGSVPENANDGTVIYEGKANYAVDEKLLSNPDSKTYYYKVFTYDRARNYSSGITFEKGLVMTVTQDMVKKMGEKARSKGVRSYIQTNRGWFDWIGDVFDAIAAAAAAVENALEDAIELVADAADFALDSMVDGFKDAYHFVKDNIKEIGIYAFNFTAAAVCYAVGLPAFPYIDPHTGKIGLAMGIPGVGVVAITTDGRIQFASGPASVWVDVDDGEIGGGVSVGPAGISFSTETGNVSVKVCGNEMILTNADTGEVTTQRISRTSDGKEVVSYYSVTPSGTVIETPTVQYSVSSEDAPTQEITNLTLTANNNGEIELAWKNPLTKYQKTVIVKKTGSFPESVTDGTIIYQGTGESFSDPATTAGTEYFYKVFTSNGTEYSNGVSKKITAVEDITPPSYESDASVTVANHKLVLNWTNPSNGDFSKVIVMRSVEQYPTSPLIGNKVYEGQNASYSDESLTNGTIYYYTLFFYDLKGNFNADGIKISGVPLDTVLPTLTVSAPADQAVLKSTVSIQAEAQDDDRIEKVEFYIDGVLAGTDTAAPYSYNWSTVSAANGAHSIQVKAYDDFGNISSKTLSVSVDNDLSIPVVAVVNPADQALLKGNLTLSANASDNKAITKVEFYIDNVLKSADTAAPYEYALNTADLSNGGHTLSARAYDAENNMSENSVSVTVDNSAPVISSLTPGTGSVLKYDAALSASIADNRGVVKAEFYINDVLKTTLTQAPYTYNWSTLTVANGNYTVFVKAYDEAGNISSKTVSVSVDNDVELPNVSIVSPSASSNLSGNIFVNAEATDNKGVTKVEFYLDGIKMFEDTQSPYSIPLASNILDNGTHTFKVKAYDAEGNSSEDSIQVVIDNEAPNTLALQALPQFVKGSVSLQADVSDAVSGIQKVEFYVDNTLKNTLTSAPFTYQWNTAGSDGAHSVMVKAYDKAGNSASTAPVSVTADNTVPFNLEITSPANGSMLKGQQTIQASPADLTSGVAKVEFYVDGSLLGTDTDYPYAMSWTPADGVHSISLKAYDKAGNVAVSTNSTITADGSAPTGLSLSSVSGAYSKRYVSLQAAATDAVSGIEKVEFYVDGALSGIDSVFPYSFVWDAGVNDGAHTFMIKAYDKNQNVTESQAVSVITDSTDPSSLVLNIPAIFLRGSAALSGSAADTNIQKLELWINNNLAASYNAGSFNMNWDTTPYNGQVSLTLKAYDQAGNTASLTKSVLIDNTVPEITLSAKNSNGIEILEGNVNVNVSATDLNGVNKIDLFINDVLKMSSSSYSLSYLWATPAGTAIQTHTLRVEATDTLGNKAVQTFTKTVDNRAPVISFISPINNSAHKGSPDVSINVSVSDLLGDQVNGLALFEWYFDGVHQPALNMNTGALYSGSEGSHIIKVRAYDTAGHVSEQTLTVNIDNTAPAQITFDINNGVVINNGKAYLNWTNPNDNITMMKIYRISNSAYIFDYPMAYTTELLYSGEKINSFIDNQPYGNLGCPASDYYYNYKIEIQDQAGNVTNSAIYNNVDFGVCVGGV